MSENVPSSLSSQSVAEAEALFATLNSKVLEATALVSQLVSAVSAAQERLAEIDEASKAALTAKTQITDHQAVIASKSSHIQDAQTHADKVRAELDRLQTLAGQSATEADGERSRAKTATDTIAELLSTARSETTAAEMAAAAATAASEAAKTAEATSKGLAEKSTVVEARIAAYEEDLAELESQAKAKLEQIAGLLPGATAAGLAHAFDSRRKTFLNPATRWQWVYVASVLVIAILAFTGLWQVYRLDTTLTWNELARLWLARLPIAGALIWLALHASRESALAKRLEEDYGYKAAVASSFQGFEKQMRELSEAAREGSPLAKLCADTLATIASPPGRIYDKHQLTVTPATELTGAAVQAVSGKSSNK